MTYSVKSPNPEKLTDVYSHADSMDLDLDEAGVVAPRWSASE